MAAKLRVRIEDQSFAHSPGLTVHHVPQYIEWVRGTAGDTDTVFFTDRSIGIANQIPAKRKVALLIEPPQIYGNGYKIVQDRPDDFDWVLTYDESLVLPERFPGQPRALYYPIGGCWIPQQDRRHDWPKTKQCSIIASAKRFTPDHILRHEIVERFRDRVDAFGHGYKPVQFKTEALAPYRYSIVMENVILDTLFTEKLIDCFLTGTVPIYYGTRQISRYFNMKGVFEFRTLDELDNILTGLSPGVYDSLRPVIEENWGRAHKFLTAEDWLIQNYNFLF